MPDLPVTMDRRAFGQVSALGLLAGVAVTVSAGCGADLVAPEGPKDAVAEISLNHGHAAVITAVRLRAGEAVRLDITGVSTHSHYVDLTADDLGRIRGGERISRHTTDGFDDKHDHVVTFN